MGELNGEAVQIIGSIPLIYISNKQFGEEPHSASLQLDFQLAEGVQPDWSLEGRTRVVRNGVRNLGQQVLEFVLIGPRELSAAEAEERFASVIRELVEKK